MRMGSRWGWNGKRVGRDVALLLIERLSGGFALWRCSVRGCLRED